MKFITFAPFGLPLTVALLAFAFSDAARAQSASTAGDPDSVLSGTMAELTSPEVEQAAEDGAIVLFPVAIIEEHGPHLDLSPDIVLVAEICREIKARLEASGTKTVIVPPLYWGVSFTTHMFPGTFAVKPETMKAILTDAVGCLKNWGFKTVILVNGHGDPTHGKAQEEVATELRQSLGIGVYASGELKPKGYTPPAWPARPANSYEPDYHAGAVETAMMMALRPGSVRPEIAKNLPPQPKFLPLGYVGNPAGFEAENSRGFFDHAAHEQAGRIAAFLKEQAAAATN